MGHQLIQRHVGGHLYNENGIGWRELDLTPFLDGHRIIAESVKLPGFVDTQRNVTYESHTFWFHFLKWDKAKEGANFNAVLIVVNHGGGWEVWEGDSMLAAALNIYRLSTSPDFLEQVREEIRRRAFLMAWSLIDIAESAQLRGYTQARDTYQQAFADGRLKKKKVRGQNKVKVWIEDKK